ncbi:MAG TPA: TIGR03118 family protein [Tepidisphaeraceae bacterium]|jgi:uncharacterized protein (TIGR03118 family)|nr:TIGR03118 family protein [Tepidisphaeraceae bacterium]
MRAKANRRAAFPALLCVEPLESRRLLSGTVLQTNLVSDLPGVAAVQDPNLVNPWGITASGTSPFWISDNNAGVSTLYSVPGAGSTPVSINSLVVSMPTPVDPLGASGTPTGTVFNLDGGATGGFKVSGFTKTGAATSAAAIFLFATEDGTIIGWNPGVNPSGFDPAKAGTYGIIAVDNSGNNFTEPNPDLQTGAVYKGLAIASGGGAPIASTDPASTFLLYATNFRSGQVEVYDPNFKPATLPSGAFSDPNLPKDYAPFNVQVLNDKVYVTYARQDDAKHDDLPGPGRGFVDVFNLDGTPGLAGGNVRLASRGALDAPWGLAIAPSTFGSLAGDLLVGNFGTGDGFINVFNPTTGAPLGQLTDPDGEPIQINGLWALRVGNGGAGGSTGSVYFTAGLFNETHGLFGSLTPVAAGTPEGPAEAQLALAALDNAQLNLTTVQNDIAGNASPSQFRQDLQAFRTSVDTLEDVDHSFDRDILSDNTGSGTTDPDAAIDTFLAGLHKLDLDGPHM